MNGWSVLSDNSPFSSPEFLVRLASAIILGCGAILVTYAGGWYFCAIICVACAVLAWEWWRLSGTDQPLLGLIINTLAILFSVIVFWLGDPVMAFAAIFVGSAFSLIYSVGMSRPVWTALGPLYIGLPALSLVWFRQDDVWGFLALVFLFLVVWATDSAAYIVGRLVGGPKLWPAVSPNKTWAGSLGGAFAGVFCGWLFAIIAGLPSPFLLGVVALALAVATQGGDLIESSMKRHFHQKDASSLIPGHGGLFDRVDGLLAAALFAAVLVLIKDYTDPAKNLLVWMP